LLGETLTDVLVERGDRAVVRRTAGNHGARFSSRGFALMASKSRDDDSLAKELWKRPDIPREVLVRIFTETSELTRRALEAENPREAAAMEPARSVLCDPLKASKEDCPNGIVVLPDARGG
jgi:hypothetical protein